LPKVTRCYTNPKKKPGRQGLKNNWFFIGVAGGAESLQVGVFGLRGNLLAFVATECATTFLKLAYVEQNPNDGRKTFGAVVHGVVLGAKNGL
jgi:hypothetical protein